MNQKETYEVMRKLFAEDERRLTICLLGAPGIGKTAIASAAAEAVGKRFVTLALPTCEAVDLRGMPQIEDGQTKWRSPLPREGQGVLLLDELSSAPPDVQVAAHHIVWAEKGSDMSLPTGWHIVLTGNRAQDKTLFRAASGPLRNRLVILNITADLEPWANWAGNNGVNPWIVGFMRWRPEMLAAREIPADGAFCSPRSWENASRILSLSVSASTEREMLVGVVGEGAAVEFCAYLQHARELPAIQTILGNMRKEPVPKSPSLLYALVEGLAQHTKETQESAMTYVARMPAEFTLLYVLEIRDRYDIRKDDEIREWVGKHKTMFGEADSGR